MNGRVKTGAWADGDGGLEIHPATALTIVEMIMLVEIQTAVENGFGATEP